MTPLFSQRIDLALLSAQSLLQYLLKLVDLLKNLLIKRRIFVLLLHDVDVLRLELVLPLRDS
jgi:hypothetical protein